MLSEKDRSSIVELAIKYHAKRVVLFGSSAQPNLQGRDIDIAVDGIPPEEFFKFYGDLIFSLSKPVDVVDLSQENEFTTLIRKEGIVLYG